MDDDLTVEHEFDSLNVEYVRGRRVCATGRLASMTRAELAKLLADCGGELIASPVRGGFLLVVGDAGWPSKVDGSVSQAFDRARQLKAYGYPIEFTSEDDFLERLGLRSSAAAIRGPHTLSDLHRILDVSPLRMRRWMRIGLIQPVATQHQIPYFDFHQVALIKQLHDLARGGASLAQVQRNLEQAKDLLPRGESLAAQCARIASDGRVLLRRRDEIVDHRGQRYFDFDAAEDDEAAVFAEAVRDGFHDLCDEGLALEEDGRLDEAADLYRRALQLEPDHPTLHFDLGNVLFQLNRSDESIAAFREAVRLDADFAMGWHNLGSVYAHVGEWDQAEASLREVLRRVPTYADSHFTLAEVLRRLGRHREAALHEQAYHQHSRADRLLASRDRPLRVVGLDEEEGLVG